MRVILLLLFVGLVQPFYCQRISHEDPSMERKSFEPQMLSISGGTFNMGCTMSHCGFLEGGEMPVHSVKLSSFWMGKFEVTVAQFEAFILASGYITDAEKHCPSSIYNGSFFQQKEGVNWRHTSSGDAYYEAEKKHMPVIHVSHNDAREYCRWLSAETGKNYRLPTEAEWEYAARGGTNSKYAGSEDIDAVAFYNRNSEMQPHPVGQRQANGYGIYDMSGNVWEWCSDWIGDYTSTARTNPIGPASGMNRVVRGGGWNSRAKTCSVSGRSAGSQDCGNCSTGFRVVFQ